MLTKIKLWFIKKFNLYPVGVITKIQDHPHFPNWKFIVLGKKMRNGALLADYTKTICVYIPPHLQTPEEIAHHVKKLPESKLKY